MPGMPCALSRAFNRHRGRCAADQFLGLITRTDLLAYLRRQMDKAPAAANSLTLP